MSRCPLCDGEDLFVFLERDAVPVHQNLLMVSPASARSTPRGNLRIACCRHCGFVTNTAFQAKMLRYGEGYENDQTWSARFEQHVEGLVAMLIDAGARQKFVVEVGCGRGSFLRRLCALGDNRGVGFDPAYSGPDSVDGGRVTFVREFFGSQRADVRPDVVVCRHVIEHVPRPLDLLGAVRAALASAPHAELAFETPAVEWILDRVVIQDFFYEHCSYFSADSLAFAFARAGFEPRSTQRIFGDQYLWLQATHDRSAPTLAHPPAYATTDIVESCARYRDVEGRRIAALRARFAEMRRAGPVAIWGAGAKGATFLHLIDPDATLVDCVVDINPRKQGQFIPGTGHPIVGTAALGERGIRNAVVMNANYLDEIRAAVADVGLDLGIHAEVDS